MQTDPYGANEEAELRCAGFLVRPGLAAISIGIATVRGRIRSGTLKIVEVACPNLPIEADLYHHDNEPQQNRGEQPVGEDDRALDALRCLISRLDEHGLARQSEPTPPEAPPRPC